MTRHTARRLALILAAVTWVVIVHVGLTSPKRGNLDQEHVCPDRPHHVHQACIGEPGLQYLDWFEELEQMPAGEMPPLPEGDR